MAAAEAIDEEYDAPNFGIDKSQNKPAVQEQPEPAVREQPEPAEEESFDDGSMSALIDDLPVFFFFFRNGSLRPPKRGASGGGAR